MSGPIRVLVVDDSVVIRSLITNLIDSDPDLEVAGIAQNGQIALERVAQLKPDIVTLDIEMPVLDGLSALKEIRKSNPRLPVIMFSTLTGRGAEATLNALELGASDYVTKPANVGSVAEGMERVRTELVPKIKALCARRLGASASSFTATAPAAPAATAKPASAAVRPTAPSAIPGAPASAVKGPKSGRIGVLAIGSSTGGPNALSDVLSALPGKLGVPVVITQHMPPVFTKYLADRLDRVSQLTVVEGKPGMVLQPDHVYIAPGDYHMEFKEVGGKVSITTNQAPAVNFCRPAVDVMLRSVFEVYGGNVLTVILTGMGADGRDGCVELQKLGGYVIAQDEATSVVWGMPGAVSAAKAADHELPLSAIAGEIRNQLTTKVIATAGAGR